MEGRGTFVKLISKWKSLSLQAVTPLPRCHLGRGFIVLYVYAWKVVYVSWLSDFPAARIKLCVSF